MRLVFSFNGIHSDRFGITMLTKSRTLLPEAKQYSYSALAADGKYDFTEANSRKRAVYNTRTFQIVMQICAENLLRLQEKVNGICSWLIGRGELIFDDIPDSIWSARVVNSVDFAPENSGCKAVLNVVFEAEPFARAQFDTLTGPYLDNAVRLESSLPITLDEKFIVTMPQGQKCCTFDVLNIGTWYVSPMIILETNADVTEKISIEYGGKKLEIAAGFSEKLIIDTEKCTVTDGAGNSLDAYTDGEFCELSPETNVITIMCGKKLEADMKISVLYTPKFLYTADFTNILEENDA